MAKAARKPPKKKPAAQPRRPPRRGIAARHLALLACPECRGSVKAEGAWLACQGCGRKFEVVDGIPVMRPDAFADEKMKRTLDTWDAAWAREGLPDANRIESSPAYADALRHVRKHAPAGDWAHFLEAGCGNGKKALILAREHPGAVVGVDISLEACRQAQALFRQQGAEGFFAVGDLRQLPFRGGAFRYIYAGGSLEHFPDTAAAIREMHRVLAPAGRLTATVPVVSFSNLTYAQRWGNIPELPGLRPLYEWFHLRLLKGRHLIYGYEKSFTRSGWVRFLKQAGFANIRCEWFETHLNLSWLPWEWLRKLARGLARQRLFWPVIYSDSDKPGYNHKPDAL